LDKFGQSLQLCPETTTFFVIVRKNFSLLLALRYLNPLRTHVSVITLISLAGVATGVMVLIVVLSVFGGFEKFIKDQVLSYTPHINIERVAPWPDPEGYPEFNAEEEWRAVEKSMASVGSVESAYALVNDYVLLDRGGAVAPVTMQAIDTENTDQLESLQHLITPENGTADMGLGENAVVSSMCAEKFGIMVGDTVQLHSSRNLQQIQPVLERIGSESFAESQADVLKEIQEGMARIAKPVDGEPEQEAVAIQEIEELYYNQLTPLKDYNIREAEKEIIQSVLDLVATSISRTTEAPDNSGDYIQKKGQMKETAELLGSLAKVDIKEEDITNIKEMKTVVLPKDIKVVGIYKASRHAMSPDIFVPLPVGQDLAGLGDGVRGIALRLKDPYLAHKVLEDEVMAKLPNNGRWAASTWMEAHQQQFGLIKTQRQLLTFALSFIMLVSAFSIMAVMFTVTIQKKREIGVMKALGAAPFQLVRVFLYQGIIIGFFGGVIGLGLGNWVIVKRKVLLDLFASWGFDPFPSDFNGFDGLPADRQPSEFLAVFLFAFIMCIIATLIPAISASRSDAAKSLRNM